MKSTLALILLSIMSFASSYFKEGPTDNYFEVNLIKNPGAEAKVTGQKIQSWEATPVRPNLGILNGTYGMLDGEWKKKCKENCGLAPNSGKSYFRFPLDESNPLITLYQEIDLTPIADIISERRVSYNLRGYFAGTPCGKDKCMEGRIVEAIYDNAGKQISLTSATVKDYTYKYNEDNGSKLLFQFIKHGLSSSLPKEASKVVIKLEGEKGECCVRGTVFFDNISYVLTKEALR